MRSFLLALAMLLLMAAPAYAGSADSNITTPTDPSFPVDDGGSNLVVAGHTDFGAADIICTYGPNDARVFVSPNDYPQYYNVPQGSGGDFAVQLPLKPLRYYACRLHAIPAGESDPDLSTLTGPRIGVGYRTSDSGAGTYGLELSPFGGFNEFRNSSECGLATSYAEDPSSLGYQSVFGCSDALTSPPANGLSRAAVQVDGHNAYFKSDLVGFGATTSPPNPAPTLSVDPATGLGGVQSHEKLATCSPGGGPFPPDSTTCHDGVADGVQLNHTASESAGGALALMKDEFASSDGSQHTVDLWVQQSTDAPPLLASAERGGNKLILDPSWSFPGDPDFAVHFTGDNVTGPALGGPGTALVRAAGGGAFGSLSWATPPDTITFGNGRTFVMHYSFTVPAGGSHTLEFGYGSAFTEAGAQSLGDQALASFPQPPAAGPPPTPGQPLPSPPASNPPKTRLSFKTKQGANGTVTVTFNAPGPGSLSGLETAVVPRSASAKTKKLTVSRARKNATKAGTVKLVLKLNKKGKKIFGAKHRLRTTLAITFKPNAGTATKLKPKSITLKLKKHRRKH